MNTEALLLKKIEAVKQRLESMALYGHEFIDQPLPREWVERLKKSVEASAPAPEPAKVKPAMAERKAVHEENEMAKKKSEGKSETLAKIAAEVAKCRKCRLCETRTNTVPGVGNPNARLMFIGEAPGADEDKKGEPFVGRAGQLLTKMISAMGLSRDDVYIANIIKCRPPANRNPEPDEVEMCEPYLIRQIETIKPEVIVALGAVSTNTLLKVDTPISKLRGEFRSYHGTPLLPTFHPAYLLRNESSKKDAWSDLQTAMKKLNMPLPGKKGSNG